MSNMKQMIVVDDIREEAELRSDTIERQVDQVMGRGPAAALQVFLSGSERKLVREAARKELRMGFDYRQEALSMALDLRLQSFREACNQVLVNGKAALRKERLEYFTKTYAEVEKYINEQTETFLRDLDQRFENIARYRNETLRKREQQRLEKRMDDFLVTFDRLMMQFASILNEEIGCGGQQPPAGAEIPQSILEIDSDETAAGDHRL